jgi:hypothetical protein
MVMECITDELSTEITNLYVEPEDICIGGEAAFRVDGGEEGVTYTLEFIDKHNGAKSHRGDVTINSSGYLEFTDPGFFVSLPVGEYYVSVLHSGKIILNKIGSLIIGRKMLSVQIGMTGITGIEVLRGNVPM